MVLQSCSFKLAVLKNEEIEQAFRLASFSTAARRVQCPTRKLDSSEYESKFCKDLLGSKRIIQTH